MEKLIERWKVEAKGYEQAENDIDLAFHTRAMAKHKKQVFERCAYELEQERELKRLETASSCTIDIVVGSILTCIFDENDEITERWDYKVLDIDNMHVQIKDDTNSKEWVYKFLFKIKEK